MPSILFIDREVSGESRGSERIRIIELPVSIQGADGIWFSVPQLEIEDSDSNSRPPLKFSKPLPSEARRGGATRASEITRKGTAAFHDLTLIVATESRVVAVNKLRESSFHSAIFQCVLSKLVNGV